MNIYGSIQQRKSMLAAIAGTATTSVVCVGDSNNIYGTGGARGLQGGFCNAITQYATLNHSGSGVVSAALNDGNGAVAGNDPLDGSDGWGGGFSGTTAYADTTSMAAAPSGATDLLDGRNYAKLVPKPIYLDPAENLGANHNGAITLSGDRLDESITFVIQYWGISSAPPAGEGIIAVNMRRFGSGWTVYKTETITTDANGAGMRRMIVTLPADAARSGVTRMQCTFTRNGVQGWVGSLYVGCIQAYYTDSVPGAINVTPINWHGGGSLLDIYNDLLSTTAKRTGVGTILNELAYPASTIGKDHHIIYIVSAGINDRNDTNNSVNSVALSNTPDGYLDNLLAIRQELFALTPAGSTASMISVPTQPTEYANDPTVVGPMRTAVADYCKANPDLGLAAINLDEAITPAAMRTAGYYDVGGQTAHMSPAGYDWWGDLVLDTMINGDLVFAGGNRSRSREGRQR